MKQTTRHRTNFISFIIVLTTVLALGFLLVMLMNHATLELRFTTIINWLERIDRAVADLETEREILICIFALYIAKCQLPIPMGILCAISGMVFPLDRALLINLLFCFFFFSVKYAEGTFIGGGWAGMILSIKKLRFIRDWIHFKGNGNPYLLVGTRLVPAIPLGMVSKYYGAMRNDFIYYSILSLVGFAPRLYIYTKLGALYKNPFSRQFIILLIIIVAFTGISTLLFNVFYGVKSRQMTQTLLIYSENEKYKIVL